MDAFVISLPHRQKPRERLMLRLKSLGFTPRHHPGVISDVRRGGCQLPGEYGCLLAHRQLLEQVVLTERRVAIFEDDALPRNDLTAGIVQRALSEFRYHAMVLLGASQYAWQHVRPYPGHYRATNKTSGTFAYVIGPQAAALTIQAISRETDAMDRIYHRFIYPSLYVPVVQPLMFIADVRESAIRGGRDPVQHAKKVRWDVNQYAA